MKLAVATLLLLACVASGEDKGTFHRLPVSAISGH